MDCGSSVIKLQEPGVLVLGIGCKIKSISTDPRRAPESQWNIENLKKTEKQNRTISGFRNAQTSESGFSGKCKDQKFWCSKSDAGDQIKIDRPKKSPRKPMEHRELKKNWKMRTISGSINSKNSYS